MNIDYKQNYEEKIRLILIEATSSLEEKFKQMLNKHSASGSLRSGSTIKETMKMISELTHELYLEVLSYCDALNLKYSPSLETDISQLASDAQLKFKIESIAIFKKSTELVGKPNLFERMLPEVEADMANNLAIFENNLNTKILELKHSTVKSPIERVLWVLEVIFLVISIFVSGMWFNDPSGNYEPFLVGLLSVISLIPLIIKRMSKQ